MAEGATAGRQPARRLGARLSAGVAWNLAGAVFNQGSTFLVNIAAANLFGPDLFGRYAAVQGTTSAASNLASFGAGYTATKYAAELRGVDPGRAGRILGLCRAVALSTAALAALVLAVFAPWIAANALRAPGLTAPLRLAAGIAFFSVLCWYQMGALAGLEAYPSLARAGIASGSLYVVLCLAGARWGGLSGLIAAIAASWAFQWGVLALSLGRESRRQGVEIGWRGIGREKTVFWRFGLPSALPSLTTTPATWLASLVLLAQADGYREMAYYSVANNFRILVLFVPSLINNVGMSLLSNQVGQRDPARYRAVLQMNLVTTALVVSGSAAVIGLCGRLVLRLFGPGYAAAHPVLLLLLAAAVFEALWYFVSQVAATRERMWPLFLWSTLPRDVLVVGLSLWLAPRWGAAGVAAGYGIAWAVALGLSLRVARGLEALG